jgi:hypothetical protein
MKYLHRLILIMATLAFLVLTISFVWSIYHSTRGLTASDIEPVQKSLQKVETALKEDADPNGILKQLRDNRVRLQTDLEIIATQKSPDDKVKQSAMADLDNVVQSLAVLQTQLASSRDENHAAVSESLAALQTLRKGIEPTATPEKIIGMALSRAASLAVQIVWPLTAIFVFLYLFTSRRAPERLAALFSNFKSVELFSAKFELGDKIKFSAEDTFDTFRKQAKNNFDHWVQKKSLEDKIRGLLHPDSVVMKKINNARAQLVPDPGTLGDYRCTIHVPDLLFAETFYQLLDYIPHQPGPETRGRIWSFRFGFIGKLWRSEKQSDISPSVTTSVEDLINNWGMTREEAENAAKQGRKSFLGVLLTQHSVPVGLFYMDAKGQNEFGEDNDGSLRKLINDQCESLEITKDLSDIAEELRGSAALIRIYSQT